MFESGSWATLNYLKLLPQKQKNKSRLPSSIAKHKDHKHATKSRALHEENLLLPGLDDRNIHDMSMMPQMKHLKGHGNNNGVMRMTATGPNLHGIPHSLSEVTPIVRTNSIYHFDVEKPKVLNKFMSKPPLPLYILLSYANLIINYYYYYYYYRSQKFHMPRLHQNMVSCEIKGPHNHIEQ